jgi:glycosyltransferase involved in cell wall biosynthesis
VRFLGARPRDEVVEVMRESDIFVISSRTMPSGEVEGSPVVTKEAQAIGLPVVATDNGGTRETLPPEIRHEIVAQDDPSALATAIVRLLDDAERWPERSRAGRAFVEAEFDWSQLAARTVSVYDAVIADVGGRTESLRHA